MYEFVRVVQLILNHVERDFLIAFIYYAFAMMGNVSSGASSPFKGLNRAVFL